MRAKVADFGLVKVAAVDGNYSVDLNARGTCGYIAPEYASTGMSTALVDVYAFGVVLMEVITGRKALDRSLPYERSHLVTWFSKIKDKLPEELDKTLKRDNETMESVLRVAELAGHCTAREEQRPDMGHAVNVLRSLVEIWKPSYEEEKENLGIDMEMSFPQRMQRWEIEDVWKLLFEEDSLGEWEPLWT